MRIFNAQAGILPAWTCAPGRSDKPPQSASLASAEITPRLVSAPTPRRLPATVVPPQPTPSEQLSTPKGKLRGLQRSRPRRDVTASACLSLTRSLSSYEPVTETEAIGFAVRFTADYLSWDELEPARRTAALRIYLTDPTTTDIGWSGRGRQRADLVTAGRTVVLGEGRVVVVEVTARIVSYHRAESTPEQVWRPPVGEATPPLSFAPASAPPPTVPGWEPGAAWWARIAPPVRRDRDGRLSVDLSLDLSAEP